ncbi:MAG: hypothetical protein IPL01_06005 [Acidobacteria bacterium]|nr:hypothetical protein [Acidobacteriota bacterium]
MVAEFAAFDVAFQNNAGNRRVDNRCYPELRLREASENLRPDGHARASNQYLRGAGGFESTQGFSNDANLAAGITGLVRHQMPAETGLPCSTSVRVRLGETLAFSDRREPVSGSAWLRGGLPDAVHQRGQLRL